MICSSVTVVVGDDGPRGSCETQVGTERDEKGRSKTKAEGVCVRFLLFFREGLELMLIVCLVKAGVVSRGGEKPKLVESA